MTKIQHLGITVFNLDRSVVFYKALGLKCTYIVRRKEKFIGDITGMPGADIEVAYLKPSEGDVFIELLRYHEPEGEPQDPSTNRPGNAHVCIEVKSLDDTLAGGLEPIGAATIPDGPNKGCRVAYIRDPDGTTIELFEKKNG
jgi:catechol 2,3-dioxygenase-like lactoylglutathione lyase family enzyme